MPRITPSSATRVDLDELEDDEPIHGVLVKPKDGWFSAASEQYGGGDRLTVDWQLDDGVQSVRDWISLRLGKQQNGTVSKLRMLLNALADKPRDTEVKWFDSDTLEWGYDDKPYLKLEEGQEVIFRGVKGTKQDGSPKFTIQKYASASKPAGKAGKRKSSQNSDDEPPF